MSRKKIIIFSIIGCLIIVGVIFFLMKLKRKEKLSELPNFTQEVYHPKIEVPKKEKDLIADLYKKSKFQSIKSEESFLIDFSRFFTERVFSYSYFSSEDQFEIFYPKVGIKVRAKIQEIVNQIVNLPKDYYLETKFSSPKVKIKNQKATVYAQLVQRERKSGKIESYYKNITLYFEKISGKWILEDFKIE